ncbi:MAG TPA: lauroyl acyltransferase [Prolixibacteraceae bacterium]|nr:lauroyl acyltransferase [Prolixibacteraceae bacterium]
MNSYLIFALGLLAQILFFGRTIAQWFKSEHAGKVISPVIFWQLSLVASLLMLLYGIFRKDFSIILGQMLVYYIYVRNLQLKRAWKIIPLILRLFFLIAPIGIFAWLINGEHYSFESILKNQEVSSFLLIWGSVGQVIFTFRFIYQWISSEKEKESVLPLGFWIISTIGSLMIFSYSIFRLDPILFLAHILGLFMYIRNILIYFGKRSLFSNIKIPVIQTLMRVISNKLH